MDDIWLSASTGITGMTESTRGLGLMAVQRRGDSAPAAPGCSAKAIGHHARGRDRVEDLAERRVPRARLDPNLKDPVLVGLHVGAWERLDKPLASTV
ncbi:MAG: hypothetical protein ACR2NB_03875 [Solirubrobacteraceae bacterium]